MNIPSETIAKINSFKNGFLKKYLMWVGIVAHAFVCGLCLLTLFVGTVANNTRYIVTPDAQNTAKNIPAPSPTSKPTMLPAAPPTWTPLETPVPTPTKVKSNTCYIETVMTDGTYSASIYMSVNGRNSQIVCDLLVEKFGTPETDENGITSYAKKVQTIPLLPSWCEVRLDNGIVIKIFAESELYGNAACQGLHEGMQSSLSQPIKTDEVFYVNDTTSDWEVCVDESKVYGNPGDNPDWYLYSLKDGTSVRVRELDSTRTWAAIDVANWILFTDLCEP